MFDEKKHVAVFIDWDNLMISIAADMGGAAPDIRRIIQRVQEFGTILVARAYAEWQVTSDRLNVYRAGVEPVYCTARSCPAEDTTQCWTFTSRTCRAASASSASCGLA